MALAISRFKSATLFLRVERLATTVRELSAEVERLTQQIPSVQDAPGGVDVDDADNR
jgi:outer membrane murein-binding lipoprotein Lpp